MKKLNISFVLLVFFICSLSCAIAESNGVPTQEQVAKLASAVWKEPIESIDITYYKDYTGIPIPIEQIRKEVEDYYAKQDESQGQSKENLKPYEIERRNKNIEANVEVRTEAQKFPRKIKERIQISGDNQRIDFVKVGPDEPLDLNTSFVHTFINTKDATSGEFISYHYAGDMDTAFIEETKWAKNTVAQFAGIPLPSVLTIQAFLGIDKGTRTSPQFIPDPNKIQELAQTGLGTIDSVYGIKAEKKVVYKVSIYPDPEAPDTRDKIELGMPDYFPMIVIICDRKDYSRVYRFEIPIPAKNQVAYVRECSNFDSQGFPYNVTEIKYDIDGSFQEKSVYKIEKVQLNPIISDKVFEFNPPEGYIVNDRRPPEKRPKNVSYLRAEDIEKAYDETDKAFREKDLATLKGLLKHKSWRVRINALSLIRGVAKGEELKKIVESVIKEDKNDEVKKLAEQILEGLQR